MNPLKQYRQYQEETAGPEEAIALVYDGARRCVDQARAALASDNIEELVNATNKAQRVFTELMASLNMDAGEVSANLFKMYEYWNWRLSQGLITKDPAAYTEVSAALADMREAWADAAKQVRALRGAPPQSHG